MMVRGQKGGGQYTTHSFKCRYLSNHSEFMRLASFGVSQEEWPTIRTGRSETIPAWQVRSFSLSLSLSLTWGAVLYLSSYRYHANSWLVKIASNGRYIFAPTMEGQIFVFNILTGQVTAMMKDHQGKEWQGNGRSGWMTDSLWIDLEVRDIIVHPYLPLLFSSGDGRTRGDTMWGKGDDDFLTLFSSSSSSIDGTVNIYTYKDD